MATILLVEDDELQGKVTKDYLESKGFEVIWVDSGKSAIRTAKTHPVELILLDMILPDIGGKEICRFMKHDEKTKAIPIIAVTVKSSAEEKVAGLGAGVDDYLPKPYSEDELLARIYASLRTKALHNELMRMNRQLVEVLSRVEILATTDPLTELFNRRFFESVIEREFVRTLRYRTPACCLMIDVDNFKYINDEYGHSTGDVCIKEIADMIRNNIRKVDTAARWGGEEFIVLLPNTDRGGAQTPAGRSLDAISTHKFPSVSRQVTASIGIACVPDASIDTLDNFIHAADLAMYEAKSRGGNRIEFA